MATYCEYIPTIKTQHNVPSTLFQELTKNISDRNLVKAIYHIVISPDFIKKYGNKLTFDKYDEPTIESVLPLLNLTEIKDPRFATKMYETQLNNNLPANITDVMKLAADFNQEHSTHVALVTTDKYGNTKVEVKIANNDTKIQAENLRKAYNIYKNIDAFLKNHGIEIKWLDANLFNSEAGLMIPQNLQDTGAGLFGVINLANNLEGFKVLTEEFSHFIIENLKNTPIIQRAERYLKQNQDIVRQLLGDEYQTVVDYYTNRNQSELIEREALGRLMAQLINTNAPATNLFQRVKQVIMNFINSHFKTTDADFMTLNELKSDLNALITNVQNNNVINEDTLSFFKQFGDTLAHATQTQARLDKDIEEAKNSLLANLEKYLHVYKPDAENALPSSEKVKAQYQTLERDLREKDLFSAMNTFSKSALDILNANFKKLQEVRNIYHFDMRTIRKYASTLTQIKNLVDTYRLPLMSYQNVCEEIIARDGENELATKLQDSLSTIQSLINRTENLFVQVNKNFLYDVLKPYFKANEIIYKDSNGDDLVIDLMTVLDCSMGDINTLNRYALAAANTDDLWVGLIDHFVRTQQEVVRRLSTENDHKVRQIDTRLRKSGVRDTRFMYEVDENNKPTGYLLSEYDFRRYQRELNAEMERLKKLDLDEVEFKEKIDKWVDLHTTLRKFTKTFKNERTGESKTYTREYRVPIYTSNALASLTSAQRAYYDSYMQQKWDFDWMLPKASSHPYRAVQMRIGSIGEAIVTSRQGILGNFTNSLSAFKDQHFATTELDNEEYDGMGITERVIQKLNLRKRNDVNKTTRFDNTPYQRVPIYFTQMLEDMSKLSTDATASLREYSLMATNYKHMHSMCDVIELIREQNKNRTIFETAAEEQFITPSGEVVTRRVQKPTESSNVFQRTEDILNMQFFGKTKATGFAITDTITTSKIADTLMRFTSFSILGYNGFTGINNVMVGKYQMFIEATGGEWFGLNDWRKAEKEYWKMVPELVKDIYQPYLSCKMNLIMELFNVGQHWKENIKNSKTFKNAALNALSHFDSNFMLDMGEHNIQMTTALAYLIHTKLYTSKVKRNKDGKILNNDSVSLYDVLKVQKVTDTSGKVIDQKLVIDPKYTTLYTEDNKKFTLDKNSTVITEHSLLIGKINQDMHGIYNKEDMMVAKRYAVGRLGTMYRNHIVPQMQKRFKSLGKHRGIYNFRSNQIEEGYYVTAVRVLIDLLAPKHARYLNAEEADHNFLERFGLIQGHLTKHQQANMRRFAAEMGVLAMLFFLSIATTFMFDDDDGEETTWIQRQWFYQLKRLQLEGTAYFPPMMISSFMQLLVSPTAVLSPLQRYAEVFNNLPNHHKILKTGPYKGHSRLYASFMRALPVYPQLKSFIALTNNDSRLKMFTPGIVEATITNQFE